jgi:phosphocarrier protein FPr
VVDVGDQVLRILLGDAARETIRLDKPAILYAEELSLAETASLDPELVLGLVTASGGPTSHSAILARALGLPALAGVDLLRLGVAEGAQIALDGAAGLVWIDTDEELLQELAGRRQTWLARHRAMLEDGQAPAQTRDGRRIEVAANVGSLATAQAAILNGAEGIGVLHQFLYLDRDTPPLKRSR